MTRVLGLFAKRPAAGRVKTRLAAATSGEFAARVADAFLRDTLSRLSPIDACRVIVFDPPDDRDFFAALAADRFDIVAQSSGDLGERLSSFSEAMFAEGASSLVLIGADSPTLPREVVEQAFAALADGDVVIVPATDGGYALIGLKKRCVPFSEPFSEKGSEKGTHLFSGIAWGTSSVLAQTIAQLPATARLTLLPPWYDVDTLDDWRTLSGHIAALRRAGLDPGVPLTEAIALASPF